VRRRRFLGGIAALLAVPAAGSLLGCGGDDSGPDAAGETFIVTNDDDADHTHELAIACADLGSGLAASYVATGPHMHTVSVTAEQLEQIAAGETVTVSFTEGHSHTFNIARPAGAC
jgi:hypothetical protein